MTAKQLDLLLILAFWVLRKSSPEHQQTLRRAIDQVTDEARGN